MRTWLLLLLLVAGAPVLAQEAAEQAIAAQVVRINEAWKSDNGAEIMREVLSDAFAMSLPNPHQPGTWRNANKQEFCEGFARILREFRPKEHVRRTLKITVEGNIALEHGVSIHTTDQGTSRSRVLNVWRREGDTWRLFFSTDTDALQAALRNR